MPRVSIVILLTLVALLSACQQSGTAKQAQTDRVNLAEVNTELGIQYMQRGEYEIAMQKFDKAIEADPTYADAHNAYGLLHSRLGQLDDAERSFQNALRLDATDSATLNNYGQFLCKRKRYAEGQAQFLKAVENPLYKYPAVAFSNAGTCAMDAGDLEAAETHFRAALERDPRLPQALMQMIDLSFRHARHLPARGYLQRYLEVGRHTARTLWLGVQIERALGDKNAVSSYGLQLEKTFPDANETRLYLESKTP